MQTTKFVGITGVRHGRACSFAQLVGRLRARYEGALICVNLTVPCPSPEGALSELLLRTGNKAACPDGNGRVDQQRGVLSIKSADHICSFGASNGPPDGLIWLAPDSVSSVQFTGFRIKFTRFGTFSASIQYNIGWPLADLIPRLPRHIEDREHFSALLVFSLFD